MTQRTSQEFGDQLAQLLASAGLSGRGLGSWFREAVRADPKTLERWLQGKNVPDEERWDRFTKGLRARSGNLAQFQNELRDLDALRNELRQTKRSSAKDSSGESRSIDMILGVPSAPAIRLSRQLTSSSTGAPFRIPPLPAQTIRGRSDLLQRITQLLSRSGRGGDPSRPVALWGIPGVGKTTAANALVHKPSIERQFRDGIVWVSLGPRPPIRPLLNDLGYTFGLDLAPERDEAACTERLREHLHRKRALLVVDDVWEPEHGSSFAVTGALGRTILTTRETLVAFPIATRSRSIRVEELNLPSALAMLGELAPDAVRRERKLAKNLCAKLERLPLVINLAGKLLAQESDVPERLRSVMSELLERGEARLQLMQPEGRLGLPSGRPASVASIIAMSVDRLSVDDQRRFAQLSVFGSEPLFWTLPIAAKVWECSIREAAGTTSRVIQRGLVERRGTEYWMHALLCDYAEHLRLSRGL
jgi:hypothetical protein